MKLFIIFGKQKKSFYFQNFFLQSDVVAFQEILCFLYCFLSLIFLFFIYIRHYYYTTINRAYISFPLVVFFFTQIKQQQETLSHKQKKTRKYEIQC